MTWTEERTEELKRLWRDGYSATVIARKIGGTTANACLGKLMRTGELKNPLRPPAEPGPKSRLRPKKPPKPKTAEGRERPAANQLASMPMNSPEPLGLPMVRVRKQRREHLPIYGKPYKVAEFPLTRDVCRWPVSGTGADCRFCGHEVGPGSPYCAAHAAVSAGRAA